MKLLKPFVFFGIIGFLFSSFEVGSNSASVNDSIFGKWQVVDVGYDCISSGWVNEIYSPKNGPIKDTRVFFKKQVAKWGSINCKDPKYSFQKTQIFDYFDGSGCRSHPGLLPRQCSTLMNELKGTTPLTIDLSCSNSESIPSRFIVLSKDYLLSVVGGDFICLKRNQKL